MIESEWDVTTNLRQMMAYLKGSRRCSERKNSLLSVAYCRRIWGLMSDNRSREAVEMLEGFAEGFISTEERLRAGTAASDAWLDLKQAWFRDPVAISSWHHLTSEKSGGLSFARFR